MEDFCPVCSTLVGYCSVCSTMEVSCPVCSAMVGSCSVCSTVEVSLPCLLCTGGLLLSLLRRGGLPALSAPALVGSCSVCSTGEVGCLALVVFCSAVVAFCPSVLLWWPTAPPWGSSDPSALPWWFSTPHVLPGSIMVPCFAGPASVPRSYTFTMDLACHPSPVPPPFTTPLDCLLMFGASGIPLLRGGGALVMKRSMDFHSLANQRSLLH